MLGASLLRKEMAMEPLTGAQRRYLRSLAHHLDPICFVGKNGLTDAVVEAVDAAFDTHELLKVKFIDCKKEKRELSEAIEQRTHSAVAGLIGNIAILYRQHREPKKRRIELP
jgi:RNA-binding protein